MPPPSANLPEEESGDWLRGTPFHRASDEQLEDWIRTYPTHREFQAAIAERQRRQSERAAQENEARTKRTERHARIAIGISVLGLLLSLLLGVIQQCREKNQAVAPNTPAASTAPLVSSTPSPSPP